MTVKQIENTWRQNFKKSPLITDGTFNPSIARQLYYGPDDDSDLPFKEGCKIACKNVLNFRFTNVVCLLRK